MAFASLTIDVNAKLANLEQGLQKASGQLDGFAAQANRIGAGLATAFGAIAGAVALDSVVSKLAATVDQMAALDDAAESTGASVESLSSILNTLAPTGVTLDQITDAAGKLAKSMAGADEESGKAAEAFKAIGVATKDAAGNLRPVDAVLTDVAQALAGYEDGTNKVVIAQALFGKSGAAMLPMLKDLATRTREAATVTTEQAAAAETVANAYRTLGIEGDKLVQSTLGPIVTKLAEIVTAFNDARRAGLGFFDSIQGSTLGDGSVTSQIDAQKKAIEGLTKARKAEQDLRAKNPGLQEDGALAAIDADIANRRKVIDFLQGRANVLDKTRLQGLAGDDPELARLLRGRSGGQAPALSGGGGDGGKAGRPDRIYAELDALIMQSIADEKLREEAGAAKELAKQLDLAADAALRRIADVDRAEQEADSAIERDVEAIKNAIDPTRQLYKELERVRELTAAGILPQDVGNARQAQILSKVDGIVSPVPDKVKEADDAARQLGLTFSSAFEDAIVGGKGLSSVLKSLRDDIVRLAVRKSITEPLINALFGGKDSSGASTSGLFSDAIGALFGGPKALGGPVSGGTTYLVGERGPELFTPKSRGTIIPNNALGGGGGVNLTLNVASGVTRQELLQAGQAFMAEAQVRILQSMRGGGQFAT
jgi:hypothetical protein